MAGQPGKRREPCAGSSPPAGNTTPTPATSSLARRSTFLPARCAETGAALSRGWECDFRKSDLYAAGFGGTAEESFPQTMSFRCRYEIILVPRTMPFKGATPF